MELLIIGCMCFVILNIHAYCMPIKKCVERIEKECCTIPFASEEASRTL